MAHNKRFCDYYYTIKNQQTEGNVTLFDVMLLPECSVYNGHFPGMPVAPGVCNIQMIKECVECIAGKPLLLEFMTQCKFITMITPEQHQELQVRIELTENEENHFRAIAAISRDETDYVIFKGEFKAHNIYIQ
jgi:3-hydroxyacyl-[acyl-carrier-protein] dehydratase